jgi:hypothetical protein
MKHRLGLLSFLLVSGAAQNIKAGTIVSVTGPFQATNVNAADAVSWTQTSAFTNVVISAGVGGGFFTAPPGSGTFYLMNAIGPGTTVANQLNSTTFSGLVGLSTLPLFSGLTLGPGTYYLVLGGLASGSGWQETGSPFVPVIVTGSGVTNNPPLVVIGGGAGYPPASSFSSFPGQFFYQVTGDAVPEPATFFYALIGLGAALVWKRLSLLK